VLFLRDEAMKRQRWVNVLGVLVIVALITIMIILFHNSKRRKEINARLELKVKERTRELEENQSELIRACSARDQLIGRAALDILNIQASVKGLFLVGRRDFVLNADSSEFLRGIERTSDALAKTVIALQRSSEG
jgi:hypothetical protein